jgi:hypothetical protein
VHHLFNDVLRALEEWNLWILADAAVGLWEIYGSDTRPCHDDLWWS